MATWSRFTVFSRCNALPEPRLAKHRSSERVASRLPGQASSRQSTLTGNQQRHSLNTGQRPRHLRQGFSGLSLDWPGSMHARLTTTALSDGEFDDAAAVFERILPSIRELDGFKGMVILSELAGNRIVALTLWENEQAMAEADSAMDGLRDAETRPRRVQGQETARFRVSGVNFPSNAS